MNAATHPMAYLTARGLLVAHYLLNDSTGFLAWRRAA